MEMQVWLLWGYRDSLVAVGIQGHSGVYGDTGLIVRVGTGTVWLL